MNILIIRFSALGDLVTLEPTFRAIRHFYPDANITFLTTGIGKGLYEDTNYFDDFIIDKGVFAKIKKARKKSYNIIFNLQCNKPSHIITLFLNKKLLINKSYTMMQKFLGLKADEYDIKTMMIKSGVLESEFERYTKDKNVLKIKLPYKQDEAMVKVIKDSFQDKKIITISTGASQRWSSKKWGKENFANLIDMLKDKYGIILIGTSLESDDAKYITNKIKYGILNMVDKTSLTKLKTILGLSDLYIGNDSGPTHIAAALQTSTITIFGSTSSAKHCPKLLYKEKEHFCIKPSDKIICHPCYKSKCPTQLECMQDIKPTQVYEIVEKYFNKESNETS